MDSAHVKRTLRDSVLRTLGRCAVSAKERGWRCAVGVRDRGQLLVRQRRNRKSRRGGGGGGASRRDPRPARKTSTSDRRKEPVVTWFYSCRASYAYRSGPGKERTSREDTSYARKNAERATMRGHFRSKYRLGKNRKDAKHLRSAGGKGEVSLPTELSKLVRPKPKKSQSKDEAFGLPSAFQNLGFGVAGDKQTPTHVPAVGRPCKVM